MDMHSLILEHTARHFSSLDSTLSYPTFPQETTEDRVQSEAPYLLFYQRRDFSFDDLVSPSHSSRSNQRTSPVAQGGRQEESSKGPCKVM